MSRLGNTVLGMVLSMALMAVAWADIVELKNGQRGDV
jgi:Na+/glutamate symporter